MDKDKIKNIMDNLELHIEHSTNRFNEFLKGIKEIKKSIRQLCDHSDNTYVPDASGNNDSYHVCNTCGLERKRF